MTRDSSYIFSFLMMFVAVIIGRMFVFEPTNSSIIWPATGLAYGILVTYHKRMVPSVSLGLFVGILYDYWIFSGFGLGLSIIVSLILTVIIIGAVYFAVYSAFQLKLDAKLTPKNLISFGCFAISVSLITSLTGQSIHALFNLIEWTNYWDSVWIWFLGDLSGFVLFGGAVTVALSVDENPFFKKIEREETIYYLIFIVFSLLFFSDTIPYVGFDTHKFVYAPFVLWLAFRLPYRCFYISALFYLLILSQFYASTYTEYWQYLINVNGFIIMMFLIFLLLKNFLLSLYTSEKAYEITRSRLNKTIEAANALMRLTPEYVPLDREDEINEAKKMFRTVSQLINKSDCGSCMTVVHGKVTYIDVIGGYDIDSLNSINFNIDVWKAKLTKPLLIIDAEPRLKTLLGNNYKSFSDNNPMVKQSVFMSVRVSKNFDIEMSFDISVNNPESYNSSDMIFFESLQLILNSFYQSSVLAKENDLLKSQILNSLLKTIELYDKDMHNHALNVAFMATSLGKKMDLEENDIVHLYWAAIVHDIGKIAVPPHILKKASALTSDEYLIVQKHSEVGFKSLNDSVALEQVSVLVKNHHERYDGKGYPAGLRGNQISLSSYVLGMAEAVVSMATKQNYSDAKNNDEICAILMRETGKQFHPQVVNAAIACINDGLLKQLI